MEMKKLMLCAAAGLAAGVSFGEGTLLKTLPFESEKEIMCWPGDCTVELDDEEKTQGKTSIVFTPDNNFCAYVWQAYQPGKTYTAVFNVKADKAPIPRIAFVVNFKKADNSSAGTFSKPIRDLGPCDDKWHTAKVSFTCPAGANRGQTMLSMFRCNATVFVDDFKLYEGGADGVPVSATALPAATSSGAGKGKMLIEVEFDGPAPSVKGVRAVK